MADLLFDWFGFHKTSKSVGNSTYLRQAADFKQVNQEISRTVILSSSYVVSEYSTILANK